MGLPLMSPGYASLAANISQRREAERVTGLSDGAHYPGESRITSGCLLGHSHVSIIILSYKPLVPKHVGFKKPPQLCLNPSIPPTSAGRTGLFVFQTHIVRH